MRWTYSIIGLLVATLLWCCVTHDKDDFTKSAKSIRGETIDFGDIFLGRPESVMGTDTLLFIADNYDGKVLTVLDTRNRRFVKHMLNIGNGPDEVLYPVKFSASPTQKELYAYMANASGRFCVYDISDCPGEYLPLKTQAQIDDSPFEVVKIGPAFVGVGFFHDGRRFHLYNTDGTLSGSMGRYPFDGESMGAEERFAVYQGKLCGQPDGHHFAHGCRFSDCLEFYEVSNSEVRLLKSYGHRQSSALFEGRLRLVPDSFIGYSGSYGTEEYCYLLYSGKTLTENRHSFGGSYIFRFRWDGSFVGSYHLDSNVWDFWVDEATDVVYGTVEKDDNEIVIKKFEL